MEGVNYGNEICAVGGMEKINCVRTKTTKVGRIWMWCGWISVLYRETNDNDCMSWKRLLLTCGGNNWKKVFRSVR